MMPQQAVLLVFDWDGTLMDSEARITASMARAIEQLGMTPRAAVEIREVIGLGLPEAMTKLYPGGHRDLHQALILGYRKQFLHECQQPERLFEGAERVLRDLTERGFLLAVATGKSRAGLDRALRTTATRHYFLATRSADEACSKPHPQMLEELMEELGVEPQQTLMVGDTEFDLEMARNAGVASLAASYGTHSLARLLALRPLATFADIRALPDLLDSLGVVASGSSGGFR
jgi:phosphoglycolate phosphatase